LVSAYAIVSIIAGIGIEQIQETLGLELPRMPELRWSLIVGMPVLLWLFYVYITYRAKKTKARFALQLIGQTAIFLVPPIWILTPARRYVAEHA
jgi:hypothetical protein